jgi:hypothetical protein
MNRLYYIELDGQQYGLYELGQVEEFGLLADTLVCVHGSEEWQPAISYLDLIETYDDRSSKRFQKTGCKNNSEFININKI